MNLLLNDGTQLSAKVNTMEPFFPKGRYAILTEIPENKFRKLSQQLAAEYIKNPHVRTYLFRSLAK